MLDTGALTEPWDPSPRRDGKPVQTARKSTAGPNPCPNDIPHPPVRAQASTSASANTGTSQPSRFLKSTSKYLKKPSLWGKITKHKSRPDCIWYLVQPNVGGSIYKRFWVEEDTIQLERPELLNEYHDSLDEADKPKKGKKEKKKKKKPQESSGSDAPSGDRVESSASGSTSSSISSSPSPNMGSKQPESERPSLSQKNSVIDQAPLVRHSSCQTDIPIEPPKKSAAEIATQTDLTYFIWDSIP